MKTLDLAYSISGPRAACGPEALAKWPGEPADVSIEIPTVLQTMNATL